MRDAGTTVSRIVILPMKSLIAILFCFVAFTINAAVPDYKAFRGTGGITITSNPPNGTIVIDGSGITAGALPSNILSNSHPTSVTLNSNLNVLGLFVATNGSIELLNDGFNMTIGVNGGISSITNWAALYPKAGFTVDEAGQRGLFVGSVTLEVQNGSSLQVGTSTAIGATASFIRLGTNDYVLFDGHIDPIIDSVGKLNFETDAWASGFGAIKFHNGGNTNYLVGVDSTDVPANGQVIKWNTGGRITWEDDTGGSSSAVGGSGAVQFADGTSFDGLQALLGFNETNSNLTIGNAGAQILRITPLKLLVDSNNPLQIGGGGKTNFEFTTQGDFLPLQSTSSIGTNGNSVSNIHAKFFYNDLEANLNGDIVIPSEFAVAASDIKGSNGPNQMVSLVVNTNYGFVPLSGSDASNSIAIKVVFTQDSTGGRTVTFNGELLDINSLPNSQTEAYFQASNGGSNATVVVPSGRYHLSELAGAGTSNTNFTAMADGKRRQYMNAGRTNINFAAIMRWQAAAHDNIVFVVTNLSADVCTMTLSAVTNKWIPIGGSLSAPFSVTNALWLSTEIRGSNVFYGAQYMANPAP